MDDRRYQDINAETIDRWISEGWEWGKPIDHETYRAATEGDWQIVLTPTRPVRRSSYDPNPCQAAMRLRNRSFRGFLSCNGCGIFGECRCGRVLQHETCGHPCPFSYPRIPCICTARTSMFRLGGGGTVWMRACRHGRCIQFQASLPPGSRARRARAQRHSWSGE